MPQHVVPKHLDAAFGGQQQAEQHRQGRRLAGAIAAEQRRGGAALDGKADPGNGDRVAVTLGQIVDFYDGREHRAYMAYCWAVSQLGGSNAPFSSWPGLSRPSNWPPDQVMGGWVYIMTNRINGTLN